MTKEIDNSEDIIDSRDVIARIDDLEGMADDDGDGLGDDEREELAKLKAFAEQGEGQASDWNHGATLIRESYFETYAQEFAEDIGAIKSDVSWPYDCIDWEKAARELRMDYSCVSFDGIDYWVRS